MSRVFAGLSGGVDSGVSAALLKKEGHDVTGCFIKIWQPEFIECTWKEDRLDAMRVCAALDIPYRELDLSEQYKKEVVETMIADYAAGRTPNPDVLCNKVIKFGAFFDWAIAEGADSIATGHYAQTEDGRLYRSADGGKDQSYFLYRVTSDQLKKTYFPVGGLHKKGVRAKAEEFNLPVAKKPDSQGLCFVGAVTLSEFLSRYIALEKGAVVDTSGKRIGSHDGSALYTLGQRHGFSIDGQDSAVPHHVVSIDAKLNTITVSQDPKDAAVSSVHIHDVHWIRMPEIERLVVQARYREHPIDATWKKVGDTYEITFAAPHIAPPGQSLVMYDQEECLGGGVIDCSVHTVS